MAVESFETSTAQVGTMLQAVRAQIFQVVVQRWSGANGANYEAVYNDLPNGTDKPSGGNVTKNQMNSCISSLDTVMDAIDSAMAAIAVVAEFDPELLNNGS